MTVVDLYTIQIIYDGPGAGKQLISLMGAGPSPDLIDETEENLTDLLPAGYRARIRRWDHPEPEGENDE